MNPAEFDLVRHLALNLASRQESFSANELHRAVSDAAPGQILHIGLHLQVVAALVEVGELVELGHGTGPDPAMRYGRGDQTLTVADILARADPGT
ncbi:MAG: hypothetical protein M0P31_18775 [Solirubrobacteraceae bacterium]|nr:hypothetical protein [Solirubrobacteraceae bacterium]